MDDKRFDQITRALGGVSGRRQAVKSIFGGAVATGLGALGLAEAEAKNKGNKGKKGTGKGKGSKSQPSAGCPVGSKVLLCHNPKNDGSDKAQCVDDSSCDPGTGHCSSSGGHEDDCVCPGYECCDDTMPTCAYCLGDGDACGAVCIDSGGDCDADEMCCSGLTCNGSGRNRTCGPKPVDCSVEPDGTTCTPSGAGTSRKGKHKGKKAHAAGAAQGVCCSGDCVVGDCCDNQQCSGTQICDQNQCENCRDEGHPCTGNQVCCANLTCAPPSNPGADNRCCPPDSTACGHGDNGSCCDNATETCSDNTCVPKSQCQNNGDCNQQQGEICCDGQCVVGECCVNSDCNDGTICQVNPGTCNTDTHTCGYTDEKNGTFCGEKSASKRKSKGAQPAGEVTSPVCCDGDCVECCSNENCEGNEVCNSDHHCVPSCQSQGQACGAEQPCCTGLTCDPTSNTCVATCTEESCEKGSICCGGVCIDENLCCTANEPGCNKGEICCAGTCYQGDCCDNSDCGVSEASRKGKRARPAGEDSGICCNHVCCDSGDICNEQQQCVPPCQSEGENCGQGLECCEGLTCDQASGTCQPTGSCGSGPACIGDLTCCGEGDAAQCVDTSSDNNNCGACGTVCPEGTACENSTCVNTCAGAGESCAEEGCCAPLVCGSDNICRECTPNGGECSLAECCSPDFTCKKAGKKHRCVKAGGGGGGGGGGNGSGCFHVGGKPIPGKPCCPRLHEEKGRCVINRWDHCDQSNQGQRSWCEHGTTCEGGRISPHHQEVCVPKGYRRRHRKGLQSTPATAPVTTPVS